MHAGVRRIPAERARHPKRLGHVQAGSGPFPILAVTSNSIDTSATTATTHQTGSATSAKQSSASTLPSSSATQPSSSAPSSAATSSAASVAPSDSTRPLATTAPSSSFSSVPTASIFTSPTPSFTSTPQTVSSATNSGLSGGAIAGIIAGAVIVGTALIVFFVRKTYLRRRERKHISWHKAPGWDQLNHFSEISEQPASGATAAISPQRSMPLSPFEAYSQPKYPTPISPVMHMRPPTFPTQAVPAPPPATYNNPIPGAAYSPQSVPSTYIAASTGPPRTLPSVRAQYAPMEATVRCTFVPSLPDELSITTGERIFIVEQYDDGWVLCANGRGERGMIPYECLEHAPSDQPDIGWRNVQRISSLNPDGMRF